MAEYEVSGIKFELDVEQLADDWDFVEMCGELEDKPVKAPKVLRYILGDQYPDVTDKLRDKNGKLRSSVVMDFFGQVVDLVSELKN